MKAILAGIGSKRSSPDISESFCSSSSTLGSDSKRPKRKDDSEPNYSGGEGGFSIYETIMMQAEGGTGPAADKGGESKSMGVDYKFSSLSVDRKKLNWWDKAVQREVQQQIKKNSSPVSSASASVAMTMSSSNNQSISHSSHRQLTLPYLLPTFPPNPNSNSSNPPHPPRQSYLRRIAPRWAKSPSVINCDYPGRVCNNCQRDLSMRSPRIVVCSYCEKTTCCHGPCSLCSKPFCSFCRTTMFGRKADLVVCVMCQEQWEKMESVKEEVEEEEEVNMHL